MKIRVSNIDRSTTDDELYDLFDEFGEVVSLELNEEPDTGLDTFTAWVEMKFVADAEEAMAELDGEWVDGRNLVVVEGHREVRLKSSASRITLDLEEEEDERTDTQAKGLPRRGGLRDEDTRPAAKKPPKRGRF
jgi:RNA recognition motif-containing protein